MGNKITTRPFKLHRFPPHIARPFSRFALCALIAGLAAGFGAGRLGALEIRQGLIRLVIHEYTGRFSLYCLTDPSSGRYEPLFTHQDPRTSFLAVNVNNRVYRLGEAAIFSIVVDEGDPTAPAIVFRSPFLLVRQEFLFIRTPGSAEVNGVKIAVHIENLDAKAAAVGLRMLIDTNLGEVYGEIPFETDRQRISTEAGVNGMALDQWWVSRNGRLSLMGSIFAGADRNPDFLHFANWKRLNDMPWKIGYVEGRNFNYPPYSIGDSAVCYYYEPEHVPPRESLSYGIFLAAGSGGGFGLDSTYVSSRRDEDLSLLRDLLARLDLFLAGEITMSAEDLTDVEQTIAQIKTRYSLP
jgi:hypothetical protein